MLILGATVRHVEAVGPAAPEVAWERYDDLTAWPDWAPQITDVDASGRRLELGVRGAVRVVGGLTVPFVVTGVDRAARRWSWIARPLGIALTLNHTVQTHPDGTRATLSIEGPTVVVTAYAPFATVALGRLVH